jgi:hypothetical protein
MESEMHKWVAWVFLPEKVKQLELYLLGMAIFYTFAVFTRYCVA